jgi:phage shock protein C
MSAMAIEPGTKRLYRTRNDRLVAGVAGGIAQYFRIDPTIVRVGWVVGSFLLLPAAPFGLLLYIILAIVIPPEPLDTL